MHPFSEEVKKEWNGWEVRAMVLASLWLQIKLVIFGSQRKYTRSSVIHFLVWFAYLMADSTATVALGTLARSQGDFHDNSQKSSKALQAFWAPFLLLHLGGPDTITAYSLEDNELWLRHFLWLVVQVGVAFYVLIRSWNNTSAFTFLVIPVFITGIIKYGERTWVLRSSSAKQLKDSLRPTPDPGPDVEYVQKYRSLALRGSTAVINVSKQSITAKNNYLSEAYFLFQRLQYLFANLILGCHERQDSYTVIHNKSAMNAFKLVAVELGFVYDKLYTKANIIYSKFGIFLRCICFFVHVSVLFVFLTIFDKHFYPSIDIYITYGLLFGAVFLEAFAFIVLLFSDWTKLWLVESKDTNTERRSPTELQNTNTEPSSSRLQNADTEPKRKRWSESIQNAFSLLHKRKRWSESMGQYNLLSFCLKDMSTKCVRAQKLLGIKEPLERYWYLTWKNVDDKLQKVIFGIIRENGENIRSRNYDVSLCKKLLARRGDYVLNQKFYLHEFLWSTIEVEFDHSLLLWHIATDLCYYDDLDNPEDDSNLPLERKISKCISDYMLYLLVICPTMLPRGIGEIRYRDTCAEATRFFRNRIPHDWPDSEGKACKSLLHAANIDDSALEEMKGDKSKSVLFYGRRLAKQLQLLDSRISWNKKKKWEMIADVWVEMLIYVAIHCEWKEHGRQLMKGGELLTHICVLMAHFGFSKQYQIQTAYAWNTTTAT